MPIKLGSLPKPVGATVSLQQDSQLQRRLQQDSIELAGKTVYLNPFLYWRRFSRDRWLREWQEWSLDPVTRKALLPISGLLLLGGLTGWFMGTQQFCRPLILQPGVQQPR